MPLKRLFKHPSKQIAHTANNFAHNPVKAIIHETTSAMTSVSNVVAGQKHYRGREIVQLPPIVTDARVQAISGLEVAIIASRVDQLVRQSQRLEQMANEINEQLDLRMADIDKLNLEAAAFNGTQAERLSHLKSLISEAEEAQAERPFIKSFSARELPPLTGKESFAPGFWNCGPDLHLDVGPYQITLALSAHSSWKGVEIAEWKSHDITNPGVIINDCLWIHPYPVGRYQVTIDLVSSGASDELAKIKEVVSAIGKKTYLPPKIVYGTEGNAKQLTFEIDLTSDTNDIRRYLHLGQLRLNHIRIEQPPPKVEGLMTTLLVAQRLASLDKKLT